MAETQFLEQINSIYSIVLDAINTEKTVSQHNKVASESYSLMWKLALITMAHFLVTYY